MVEYKKQPKKKIDEQNQTKRNKRVDTENRVKVIRGEGWEWGVSKGYQLCGEGWKPNFWWRACSKCTQKLKYNVVHVKLNVMN